MKIHTNVIGYTQTVRNALKSQIELGRIAPHVSFKKLNPVRSRSHQFAFEIQLQAGKRDNGRRAGNSGSYGAMVPEIDGFAATHDEWGWFLAALYSIDENMIVGTVNQPTYEDRDDFHDQTGMTYAPEELIHLIETLGDPYPFVTTRTNTIGRRGVGRSTGYNLPTVHTELAIAHYEAGNHTFPASGYIKYDPRTVEWVRDFAKQDLVYV